LQVIPFDDTPPDVSNEGRVLFYGSTTLMKNVVRTGRWYPGMFFDETRFSFGALRAGYGAHLVNADSEVMTVASLVDRNYHPDDEFFVRPAGDLKEFTGRVFSFHELASWRTELASTNGPLSLDTVVQVAAPKTLHREWRTIIVNGKVITASQYRSHGHLKLSDDVPPEVLAYAAERAAEYAPAPVFVLDVGEVDEGLRVIETNCFNCAGFYWCDVYEVVRAVTDYLRTMPDGPEPT
jgi:hypothetical protein